jgi:hypothetical protein
MNDTASYEDRRLARKLFDFLEDRRTLYSRHCKSHPLSVTQSVMDIRKYLTQVLETDDIGSMFSQSVRNMRGACRQFLDDGQPIASRFAELTDFPNVQEQSEFAGYLGEFRARIGEEVAKLSAQYDLEVPGELRRVLPPAPE